MMTRIIAPYKLIVQYRQESVTMEVRTLSVIVDTVRGRIVFSSLDDLSDQFNRFITAGEIHLFVKRGFVKGVPT